MMVTRKAWLYYAPYSCHLPVVSLGPVTSSFLLSRRRRQGESGCLFALDVNSQSPPSRSKTSVNKGKVTPDNLQGCKREFRNRRVAKAAVRLLTRDQGIEGSRLTLPPRIRCGQIRSAVRSVFPDLTPVQELSVKTAQKLEKKPCDWCSQEAGSILDTYKEQRFSGPDVDFDHLSAFRRALAVNVPSRWNVRKYPYIPTGSATQSFRRSEGGSWNEEEFSPTCRAELVHSSGKPRVVTLYSGHVSETLSPLHDALYASLSREGWLLVGSPTNELVKNLNGSGPYVSVDYKAATDNILSCYTRVAVEVLIEKAEGLTDRELQALRVVHELRFVGSPDLVAYRGQPMGCLMSFPILCLINKAVVDLALAGLAEAGKVSWKEFRAHRCLINGDDLLYREFGNSHDILAGILYHGSRVGLVVNEEKTMVHPDLAEINSTLFDKGVKQKKTNVSVVEWKRDITDPIGFLADSVRTVSEFRRLLGFWKTPIRNARRKIQGPLPPDFFREVVRSREIRDALEFLPAPPPMAPNPFPVVAVPAGYDLTRGEEICYISERVARLKWLGYKPGKPARHKSDHGESFPIQRMIRKEKPAAEDNILKVLADGWQQKTKEKLLNEDPAGALLPYEAPSFCPLCYEGRHSNVSCLIDMIRAGRQRKTGVCQTQDAGSPAGGEPPLVGTLPDFIPFE